MPAGYVIAQLKVTNPENYKEYVAKVSEVVKKYDGEYLVRNGEAPSTPISSRLKWIFSSRSKSKSMVFFASFKISW